jgi:hypothetical protein
MSAIIMSEERRVNRKLTQIKKYCETYILSAIEHEADGNRMARFKTRIENQIIRIYTDHPGYKDTIKRELFLIEQNTFGLYFREFGFGNAGIIIASNHFEEMAIKYHDQQNLPVIATASCNSTRTVGGKKKNKTETKKKNKSKTRRRSRI